LITDLNMFVHVHAVGSRVYLPVGAVDVQLDGTVAQFSVTHCLDKRYLFISNTKPAIGES
jgi:hypothetical protein